MTPPKPVGRPPTIGSVKVAVPIGREHLAYLRTVDGNRSAAIRRVIEEHRALHWLLAMANKPGWIDPPLPVGVELDPAYAGIAKRRVEEALANE